MRRKWMAALCVASLSMAMMTGCGNGSTQETAKETQTETQTQAETQSETQTETASETEKATETESETAKAEKAAETEAKEKTMYVSGDVYMREAADKDAKAMTVLATGKELPFSEKKATGNQVKVDDKEGYVVKKYITDSKERQKQLPKQNRRQKQLRQLSRQQKQQPKQAAEQAAQQAAQQPSQSAGGKTEVSRQAYDDCDGSGHGYYEITYSDGSTAIEEY
mgnify:CR=1 FL=1